MSEKEKINGKELEEVAAGASEKDKKSLGKFDITLRRSGPYKCPLCGEDYYLGDCEIDVGMCQKCWHNPNRLHFVKDQK